MFISYAQNFEDVMLWRALGHVERGCYVDVGAQHPRVDSVSRAFYERGWRGVHVEPVPQYAALLREDRPDELVLQVAVAELAGTRTLHLLQDTGLSTFDAALAASHQREHGFVRQEIIVPTLTLDHVFEAAGQAQIHWLKIDVEGAERAVLQGWDTARFRPWIVLIEATVPGTPTDNSADWDALIIGGGYQFVYFDGLNRWYVRGESSDLASAFQVPPNVFDGFVRVREIESARARDEFQQALAQAEARATQAEASATESSAQFQQALAQAEARATQAEASATESSAQPAAVYASTSWRICAPLRFINREVRQIATDVRAWLRSRRRARRHRTAQRLVQRAIAAGEARPGIGIGADSTPWTRLMASRLEAARAGMKREAQ